MHREEYQNETKGEVTTEEKKETDNGKVIEEVQMQLVSPRMENKRAPSKLNLLIEKMESATNESPRLERKRPELSRGPSKINLLVEKMEACSATPEVSVASPRVEKRRPELTKSTSKINLLIEKAELNFVAESPRIEKKERPELTKSASRTNLLIERAESSSATPPNLSVLSPRMETKRPVVNKSPNILTEKAESSSATTPNLSVLSPRMETKRPEVTMSPNILTDKTEPSSPPDLSVLSPRMENKRSEVTKSPSPVFEKAESSNVTSPDMSVLSPRMENNRELVKSATVLPEKAESSNVTTPEMPVLSPRIENKRELVKSTTETNTTTPDISVLSPRMEKKRPELIKSTSKINLLIEKAETSFAPPDIPSEKKRPELSKGTSKLNLLSMFEKGEETTESPRVERKRPELSRVTSKINLLVEAGKQKSMSKLPIPLKNHKPAFIESLASNLQEALREWLPDKHFNLIYQATRDGFEEDQFHLLCDNQGPSLSIIQSPDGFLFGGYNPENWESPDKPLYKTNPSTFIFTFTNPHSLPPTKYTFLHEDSNAHSTKNSKRHGLSFGEQVFWSGDLQISSSDHSGYVNINFPVSFIDSTGKGDLTFIGASRSPIQDLLVYSVK